MRRSGDYKIALLIVLLTLAFYHSAMRHRLFLDFHGNCSGFIHIKQARLEKVPFLKENEDLKRQLITDRVGYDGQFYYYISFDPLLTQYWDQPGRYRAVVDNLRYRYGRIGYPLMIFVFSLGRPEYFPGIMMALILASHCFGVFMLMKILGIYGRSCWWALLYVLIPGFVTSLNLALPESIAAAFLISGYYFYLRKKFWHAAALFSVSVLVRETGYLFVLMIALFEFFQRKRPVAAIRLALSIVPYFLWKSYLTWRIFPIYGWSTLFYSPGDFTFPFAGILTMYTHPSGVGDAGLMLLPFFICSNLVLGAYLTWKWRDNGLGAALLLFSILHVSLNYSKLWLHLRNIERASYEGFLVLILSFIALPGGRLPKVRHAMIVIFILLFFYSSNLSDFYLSYRAGLAFLKPLWGG